MWKRTLTLVVLGIAATIPLAAGGCASNSDEKPNAVTGNTSSVQNSQNPRYLDQKGHYHPEWVGATGH
jgi:hypothetical protein